MEPTAKGCVRKTENYKKIDNSISIDISKNHNFRFDVQNSILDIFKMSIFHLALPNWNKKTRFFGL